MVWRQPPLIERLPRLGDYGPRQRRYVGETAVDGLLEPGTPTGRDVEARARQPASEAGHLDVLVAPSGVGVTAHDPDHGVAHEMVRQRDVDRRVVHGTCERDLEGVTALVEPVPDRLVDGAAVGRALGELGLRVEPVAARSEGEGTGRVGDLHSGVDGTPETPGERGSPRVRRNVTGPKSGSSKVRR